MSSDPQFPGDDNQGPEDVIDQLAQTGGGSERQVWVMYPERQSVTAEQAVTPFEELLQVIPAAAWEGRRFLLQGVLIGLGFGLGYLLLADAVFLVKTLVHVERRESVTEAYDPVRSGSTFIATQAEVISSPRVVRPALESIGLPEPSDSWRSKIKAFFRPDLGLDRLDLATRATVPLVQATPVLGTEVMAVTYRTDDPQRGVAFLGSLIDSYRDFLRDGETSAHRDGLGLLRLREQEIGFQLAERRAALEEVLLTQRTGQDVGDLGVQRRRLSEQAMGLVDAENDAIRLENQLESLRRQDVREVANDEMLLEELRMSETLLAELNSRLSDRHPDVRQARQRVAALSAQVRDDARARIAMMERDLEAARRTHVQIRESYDRQWESARGMERAGVVEANIRAEIGRLEEQRLEVGGLLAGKELRVLELESARTGTLVSVLEPPMLPLDPVWPLAGPVLIGCAFVGALGGVSWAVLRYVQSGRLLRTRPSGARMASEP